MLTRLTIATLLICATVIQAEPHRGKTPPKAPLLKNREMLDRTTPTNPLRNSPGSSDRESRNPVQTPAFRSEEQLVSTMISFWSLSNGRLPNEKTSGAADFKQSELRQFQKSLPTKANLDAPTRKILNAAYTPKNKQKKFEAREKFINFVSAFQKSFPKYASILPDMLTAWGETRDISGFLSSDSLLLQAKMATVIQVLRNRTQQAMNLSRTLQELGEAESKWTIATKRYQFSSFEPYDVNLRVLALGPKFEKQNMEFDSLSAHDKFALQILAKVILRMQNGEIDVKKPISLVQTRHYLTPTLVRYTRRNERLLKQKLQSSQRLAVIRIPKKAPAYLAIVPNWSAQEALIEKPTVLIKQLINSFTPQEIPPNDFIYFQGVL